MGFQAVKPLSVVAGAVVALNRLVKINSSGRVIQGAAGTDECIGVSLENAAANGDAIPIALLDGGKMEIESGAAVSAGDEITSDATGRAVAATIGQPIAGWAEEAAAGAGEFITVIGQKGSIAAP